MSSALAIDPGFRTAPALPSAPAPERAAAPRPVARPRVAAAVGLAAGAVAIVAAQLLLSIGTADGAYRLAALQQRSAELSRQQQVATERLQDLAAPQRLAATATALGMVPDDSPAYLDARTGAVLGSAARATGTPTTPGGLLR